MADRPIIFSAPMIAALLAGRKTQTRRLAKVQIYDHVNPRFSQLRAHREGGGWRIYGSEPASDVFEPRFAVGDRLYVRENHALVPSSAYRMSEGVQQTVNPADRDEAAIYAAGWERSKPRWRPSIHMPRWASRLTLLVTDVRVERLQDISHADAAAEGLIAERTHADGILRNVATDECKPLTVTRWQGAPDLPLRGMERAAFRDLWERINGPDAWAANPWIVAVTFSVHARNIDQLAPIAEAAE